LDVEQQPLGPQPKGKQQTVRAEVGVDLREFPAEKSFPSWLGLSPRDATIRQSTAKV
jgi:hypothetical protein